MHRHAQRPKLGPPPPRHSAISHGKTVPPDTSTFAKCYLSLCQLHTLPVVADLLTPSLDAENSLYIDIGRVKRVEAWPPICKAIHRNRDLVELVVYRNGDGGGGMRGCEVVGGGYSNVCRRGTRNGYHRSSALQSTETLEEVQTRITRIMPQLINAICECLIHNPHLVKLELAGFVLRDTWISTLAKGLYGNQTVQEVSLARTLIGDTGLSQLCPSIRTIANLCVLNLGACQLTERGAFMLSGILKSLAVKRQAEEWAWSLRPSPYDSVPTVPKHSQWTSKSPRPLQRLTVCENALGDAGCEMLLDAVGERVGLLALDMQMNGLTNKSGVSAMSMLKYNDQVCILDLRNNAIDGRLLEALHAALASNEAKQRTQATTAEYYNGTKGQFEQRARMRWLDGIEPLKDTHHYVAASTRTQFHTESSIKKVHMSLGREREKRTKENVKVQARRRKNMDEKREKVEKENVKENSTKEKVAKENPKKEQYQREEAHLFEQKREEEQGVIEREQQQIHETERQKKIQVEKQIQEAERQLQIQEVEEQIQETEKQRKIQEVEKQIQEAEGQRKIREVEKQIQEVEKQIQRYLVQQEKSIYWPTETAGMGAVAEAVIRAVARTLQEAQAALHGRTTGEASGPLRTELESGVPMGSLRKQ